MTLTITGIYENGVIKPLQPIDLPEGTRVLLSITPLAAPTNLPTSKTPAEILAEIAALSIEETDAETLT